MVERSSRVPGGDHRSRPGCLGFTESGGRFFRAMPIAQPANGSPAAPTPPSRTKTEAKQDPGLAPSASTTVGVNTSANASSRYTITMRFSETNVGGDVGAESVIDLRNGGGTYDAGFVCKLFDLDELRPVLYRGQDAHTLAFTHCVRD